MVRDRPGGEPHLTAELLPAEGRGFGAEVVVGIGGGKTLDTTKNVGVSMDIPLINMPTTASTDASTSGHAVVYKETGEVNTLMSGVGFENTGCAGAHSIQQGISFLPGKKDMLHGEEVAFGVICQLIVENRPMAELDEVLNFCLDIGLPVTLADLHIENSPENIRIIAESSMHSMWNEEPVCAVSTISATGSEMDGIAVISDLTKNEKWATAAQILRPVMSILDPEYTFTVSPRQTSAGTADIISHIFENYFTNVPGAAVQAHFCEALLKTAFTYGPAALKDPTDYEARANLMWTSCFAINGLLQDGAEVTWCVHPIEHELSAFYDIVHGEGLAILTPRWMRHVLSEKTASKFADYGRNVWNISGEDDMAVALRAIAETEKFFFQTMRLPSTLRDVGISDDTHFEIMAEKAAAGCAGAFVPLSKEDILSIFRMSL